MSTKEQTVGTYNAQAAALAKEFNDTGARTQDMEKAFGFFPSAGDLRVLEIGCGNGRDAAEIVKHTAHYIGMDIAEELLKIARTNMPTATFVLGDIETYAFPATLDVIFAFASLLHSPQEQVLDVLRHAHAALVDGGIFYISLKEGEYREHTKHEAYGPRTFYYYTPQLIEELAGKGYETVLTERQHLRNQDWFTIALRKKLLVSN